MYNKQYHKDYNLKNRERISQRGKEYYNRNIDGIKERYRRKRIEKGLPTDKLWTKEHIQFLKDNYKKMSFKEMAILLNKSRYAVQIKANRVGLKRMKYNNKHGKNNPNWKEGKTFFNCIKCNRDFRSGYNNAKFCSKGCEVGYKVINNLKIDKICLICNKNFKVIYSKRNTKFCSLECAYGNRTRDVDNRIIKNCIICNNGFKINLYKKETAKYCSRKCRVIGLRKYFNEEERREASRKCGREYYKKTDKTYFKAKRHRRMALLKYKIGDLTHTQIKQIFERDRFCVYCGSDNNLELDHIIPITHEIGNSVFYNYVLACRNCNRSKRNKNVFIWCKQKEIKIPDIVKELIKKQFNYLAKQRTLIKCDVLRSI